MKRVLYYQKLPSVQALRACLDLAYQVSNHIGRQSRLMVMTDPQSAGAVLLPQALHLGNSIDALIEDGLLLGAGVLMRPMWERLGMACFLRKNPKRVVDWRTSWQGSRPPSFREMLDSIDGELDDFRNAEGRRFLNSIIHGNWSEMWLSISGDGTPEAAVASGPNANAPEAADSIAMTTAIALQALTYSIYRLYPLHVTDLDAADAWRRSKEALADCALHVLSNYDATDE